jgi:hypothetical protein
MEVHIGVLALQVNPNEPQILQAWFREEFISARRACKVLGV